MAEFREQDLSGARFEWVDLRGAALSWVFLQGASLRAVDLLLTVAGAPLYSSRELALVERLVRPGEPAVATWAREGRLHEAGATV